MWRVGLLLVAGCSFQPGGGTSDDQPPEDAGVDAPDAQPDPPDRVPGAVALYAFDEPAGAATAHDVAGVAPALDLAITNPAGIAWTGDRLRFVTPGTAAVGPGQRAIAAVRAADQVTLEAWVRSSALRQPGPGPGPGEPRRIATLAVNGGARNIALGQLDDQWTAQLRTTGTGAAAGMGGQGKPVLAGPLVTERVVHLAVTSDGARRRFYVDGTLVADDAMAGPLDNWDANYALALGADPSSLNNAWSGELLTLAIYARALDAAEVRRNLAAGPL